MNLSNLNPFVFLALFFLFNYSSQAQNKQETKLPLSEYQTIKTASLDTPPPPTTPTKWFTFSPSHLGVQVDMPRNIKREVTKKPSDLENEFFDGEYFISFDPKKKMNYFMMYIDMPRHMYLEDKQIALEEYKNRLIKTHRVSSFDTIEIDGLEGRSLVLWMKGKLKTEYNITIRGNRYYIFARQNLIAKKRTMSKDNFYNSIKFLDYAVAPMDTLFAKDSSFCFSSFAPYHYNRDSTNDFLIFSDRYIGRNPNSGGSYCFDKSLLHPYFYTANIDTFLKKAVYSSIEEHTIIFDEKISTRFNTRVMEYTSQDTLKDSYSKNLFWIEGQNYCFLMLHGTPEEFSGENASSFFNSYQLLKPNNSFDPFESKAALLLEDLNSSDSMTKAQAINGFEQYTFLPEDLPLLYQAIKKGYTNDTLPYGGTSLDLIHEFSYLSDSTTLPFLKKLYSNSTQNVPVQAAILKQLPNVDTIHGMDIYLDLLINHTPKSEKDFYWHHLLSPLQDNSTFTQNHLKELCSLLDKKYLRNNCLRLFHNNIRDSLFATSFLPHNKILWQYTEEELTDLDQNINNKAYSYPYTLINMLHIFKHTNQLEYTNQLSNSLLQRKKGEQAMYYNAMNVRLDKDLKIDEKLFQNLLKDEYYRFDFMKKCFQQDKMHLIPNKYLQQQSFATSAFYNYMYDEEISKLKYKTTVQKNDGLYYIFDFLAYDSKYLGVVGPFKNNDYKDWNWDYYTNCHSDWEPAKKDWKSQIDALISDKNKN